MTHVSRPLRALVSYVPRVLHTVVPYVPRAVRTFCLTYLVSYVPFAKRAVVSHVSYMLLYLICLVPRVFLGRLFLELNVL